MTDAAQKGTLRELLGEDPWNGIAWASTPEAKAQFRAAREAARRIGASISDTEITVMLWAAHDAPPEPEPGNGRTRHNRELRFEAEGSDDGQLPGSFRLDTWVTPQVRDGRVSGGWAATGPAVRAVLARGISRRELEKLLGDGINWLAWDGDNG